MKFSLSIIISHHSFCKSIFCVCNIVNSHVSTFTEFLDVDCIYEVKKKKKEKKEINGPSLPELYPCV